MKPGGTGYLPPDVVEYDLDNEDEDWLAQYNIGGTRLPADKFERILWKLELGCAEATDNALQQAGGWRHAGGLSKQHVARHCTCEWCVQPCWYSYAKYAL